MEQRNAADEEVVSQKKEKNKLKGQQEKKDLSEILSTPTGRRYIWRILTACGIYRQSANASGSWTYYNEGQRSIGLIILKEIMDVSAEAYLLMIQENKGEQ